MALSLDGSSPAAVQDSNATTSTASYSIAAGTGLIAFVWADAGTGALDEACTVTSTGGLTWSLVQRSNGSPGSTCEVWKSFAQVATSAVISVTDNKGSVAKRLLVKGILGGVDTTVVGASSAATGTSGSYTSTIPSSLPFFTLIGTGNPTADTGYTLVEATNATGPDGDSTGVVFFNTVTAARGSSVGLDIVTSSGFHNVSFEVIPAPNQGIISSQRHPGRGPSNYRFMVSRQSTDIVATAPDQNIVLNAITSAEVLGYSAISLSVSPASISSDERFGNFTSTLNVSPTSIVSAETFGNLASATNILPGSISTNEVVSPITVTSSVTVAPASIITNERFGNFTSTLSILPASIITSERFGNFVSQIGISVASIVTEERFGSLSVAPGAVTIAPSSIITNETFGNLTIVQASFVQLASIVSNEIFGNLTAVPGSVTITPVSITTNETFGNSNVATISTVNLVGIESYTRFGNFVSSLNVGPASIRSEERLGVLVSTLNITPAGISTTERFGNLNVGTATVILPHSIVTSERFGNLVSTPGAVVISLTGVPQEERFGVFSIALGSIPGVVSLHSIVSGEKLGNFHIGNQQIIDIITSVGSGNIIANVGPEQIIAMVDSNVVWRDDGTVIAIIDTNIA